MIFNSVTYLLFLAVAVCLYWSLPRRARLWMILLSSLAFYGFWRPEFLVVMIFSALTDYFVALRLERNEQASIRKALLAISLSVNLGLLIFFKYLSFLVANAWTVLGWIGVDAAPPVLDIILPLGISFYTFQTISYTVDVYRRQIPPERDAVLYMCFVVYFPQLVAGPIVRAGELLYQLDRRPAFNAAMFVSGLKRIVIGLFIKVILADNVAPLVDSGFSVPPAILSALDVWTLAFLFGLQIYFDFSAYSHIAIGSARLMGIRLPENFNFPYFASSPREFWKRWHISLSSWIRDYLYLPLLGVRARSRTAGGISIDPGRSATPRRALFALFASWGIMGLWHGANWTFGIWGLYHAALIAMSRVLSQARLRQSEMSVHWFGIAFTLPAMMLAWIPFRATSIGDVFVMFSKVLSPNAYSFLGLRENTYLIALLLTIGVLCAGWLHQRVSAVVLRKPRVALVLDASFAAATVPLVFVFLRPTRQFIYFQF